MPAFVWGFLFYMQLFRFEFPPPLPNLLIALINGICVVLFIRRSEPSRTGTSAEMVLALSGTFITAFMPEATAENALATFIQIVGLLAWAGSLLALGRSLGIAPADRGLRDRGPYALVRHPVYASELIFLAGFSLAAPSIRTALILGTWSGLQILRILREERIIAGYEAYAARVRWRVIPGVW